MGLSIQGLEFIRLRVSGAEFGVSSFGFRVQGFGFRVLGFGSRVAGFEYILYDARKQVPRPTGVPRSQKNASSWDTTVGICLGPYGGPKRGGVF